MTKNKAKRGNPQGKSSKRVVGKNEHRNAPVAVARKLIKEAYVILSDPWSKQVHAPAEGWETYNKGIHTRTKSSDMVDEIILLQRSGTVPIRVNSKRLATKLIYSENTIDTVLKLFVELDLIQPLGRGLYAVGQVLEAEAVEVLIPLEITMADLREIRSLKVTRNKQGELRNTNSYRRIFQEWIRVRMALRLMKAYRQGAFGYLVDNYLEKANSQLKRLDKLHSELRDIPPPAKSGTSWRIQEILKDVKTLCEQLLETRGFEKAFLGKNSPNIMSSDLRSLKRISLKTEDIVYRCLFTQEKTLQAKSTRAFSKSNNSKRDLRRAENLQQQYISDEHEATLRLMFQARSVIYHLSDRYLELPNYHEAQTNVRRAVKMLIQVSRDSGLHRSDLAKSLFDFRKERSGGRMPPRNWWGSDGFMEDLGNITNWLSRVERVRRERESNPKRLKAINQWLTLWRNMSRNMLRLVAISGNQDQVSDERNMGIFIAAYDQWREMKDEVEYRRRVELTPQVFIAAQIEMLFKEMDDIIQRTGVVHFELMLQGARVRVERYIDRKPSDMDSLTPKRRGELRVMFESRVSEK